MGHIYVTPYHIDKEHTVLSHIVSTLYQMARRNRAQAGLRRASFPVRAVTEALNPKWRRC